ncbi:uncharacterized protein LOC117640315 isoform X2 [Thrips palmi]|uniref:Uncharacterized protein LOC117640315 isoform X2 n=1 Tax=Thrips palmi TaxID=161013 RepID=A0A6P8YFE7_THRPL|nr:uncharacterized protein LOC117640315 isoform X2 [Thrips palmi]
MYNGRKKVNEDKTRVVKGRSENLKMEAIPALRPPSGLLDMLAEVASQTLHSDPTVKTSPAKKKAIERAVREPREKPEAKEAPRRKVAKLSVLQKAEIDTLTSAKLRSMSVSQQLRLCSRLDGDEMRRTFTYTCLLEPELCGQTFSSFGSEGRARQMMRTHLLEHLKNHGPDEPIHVSRRRRTTKVQNVKKKPNPKVKVEPVKASRLRYSELYDEVNNLPVNNKENKVEGPGEWRTGSEKSQQKLQSLNLVKIVDIPTPAQAQPAHQIQTILPVQQGSVDSDEDTVSCCSTGSRYGDLPPPGSPSRGERPAAVDDDSKEQEGDGDKSIYTEHSYTSRGTEASNGSIINSVYNSDVSRIFIKTEPGLESPLDSPDVFVETLNKRISSVGREIDVRTEPPVKTIKSAANIKDILKSIMLELTEDLPVLCDNRREPINHELNGRDTRELTWETTAVERDEFHQHKKPKGKAKFIGQSKAEKEMAIRLINAIKTKGSAAGLQSLDTLECRICRPPRCFTAPTTLMSHYRSHAGIKPYECRICRAAFTRQHSLNYHMLIHSNQTRFTCHDCGRKFRHPSHFKEHRRRHTGESPFECSDCLLRFKTRNTYKRHLKTRHGKVLTTSGGLIILSEEEFKRVRTMPRSPLSHQSSRSGSLPGKVAADAESDEEEEEEDDYSSSGAEDLSDKLETRMSIGHNEVVEEIELTLENCVQEDVSESVVTEETNDSALNLNDIVREAIRQSDISFADNERKANSDSSGSPAPVDWSTEEVSQLEETNEGSYATAVVQIANTKPASKVQVLPVGVKRNASPAEALRNVPTKAQKKSQESVAGNTDNLATILSGQTSNAAIPQSLALLQSRYLVGKKPGISVIGSDSQQATVLLLANQNMMQHQSKNDPISLMLA